MVKGSILTFLFFENVGFVGPPRSKMFSNLNFNAFRVVGLWFGAFRANRSSRKVAGMYKILVETPNAPKASV